MCFNRRNPVLAELAWLLVLVLPSSVLAQSADPTVLRDFYSTPGLNPFEERINDNFSESISPFNGILQFTNTDIYLPGNGGMDLSVIRRYQSSVEDRSIKQVYGYGWEISYGELRFSTANVLNTSTCTTAAGLFDTKDNPVFITPEGSSELLVANDGSMAMATDAILVSKGRFKLGCEPVESGSSENVWVVYSPAGMRYELGYQTPVADINGRLRLYVTKISNSNGNSIEIDYATNPVYVDYITSVYDSSDGRVVNFGYAEASTNDIRLESINSGSQQWSYEYQSIYEYNDAVGALSGFLFYPDYDNYHLLRVVRADGEDWEYAYHTEELVPGETRIYQNRRHLIKEVNYPYGGNIEYEYQDVFFGESSAFYAKPHQVIKTKKINTIGADRISNLGPLSSENDSVWMYSFFPGQGGLAGNSNPLGDLTEIQTPVGTETYLHFGYEHTVEGDIWKIGLLASKSIKNERDEALYIEQNTWAPQAISTEAYWNGRGPSFRDSETRAPLLVKKEIVQHGLLYTTDSSNHDNFGNPVSIVRGGSSVSDTIDTTYSYFTNTNLWIVNRPKNESTTDVGTITRTYDAKGNLEQQDNYGVVSSFTYTPEGDLETETDANNRVATYSDYYRGIPRSTVFPENQITTRTVNPTGTVESETNSRGFVTQFDYDVMNRLIMVDYPVHADVSIDYATSNDRLIRTLARGKFKEVTHFNNFLNSVQVEKFDLVTGSKITTVNEFDILGRQTFTSRPTYGSYPANLTPLQRDQFGVTTVLDALGRGLEVRNPGGTQRITAYNNQGGSIDQPEAGSVRLTDERGNITINRFIGYGSPGDNRPVRIEASENMTTTAHYDKLGNVTRIWQGEQGGSGHERLYNFDSHFFLVSEDHPEIGHVVFGRDPVGNLISLQIKNSDLPGSVLPDSGVTSYVYDGLNRLEEVDYPGATPDVSYAYDAEDNIKVVSNTHSNRAYYYDENNNLVREDITIDVESYSLDYGYNDLDYLDTITYPSGHSVIYDYDAFGRPTGIVNYVDQVTYFPGGQKETLLYANGLSTTFTMNNREWVNSIKVGSKEQNGLVDLAYLYDGRGNVEQIIDGLGINNRVMTYDGVDRLKSADGMWGGGSFDYDHEDNMVNRAIGSTIDQFVVSNNKMLQLKRNGIATITPLYDVYGNQLNTATRELVFDDASNLRSAKIPFGDLATDVFFEYDGNNRRVSRRVGQVSPHLTHYVYSKGDVVFAEIDVTNDLTKENVFLGSQIVASSKVDNSDPVAQISLQASAQERVTVVLDGSRSFDPDGSIDSYLWTQKTGTPVSIIDLGNGLAEFETPIVVFNENLVFELQVTDDDGNIGVSVAGIVVRQTDTDDDDISDFWEASYFPGDLSQLGGTSKDFDNDGFSDLEEFQNGTEPDSFDRLDGPTGVLVTTGIASVGLAWPAVGRASRYAVYSGTTPVVSLADSNRTYTSSSPFIQEDLNNGQLLYYVIVAERLDINGNFLGNSEPSDVISVKVGWDAWPQRIVHSTQDSRVEDENEWLKVSEAGDVEVTWRSYIDGDQQPLTYRSYTQNTGWSATGNTAPSSEPDSDSEPPVRVIKSIGGLVAEYYDATTGWGGSEQILADPANEYFITGSEFNSGSEGVVLISRVVGQFPALSIDQYYLFYTPASGWTTLQLIPINPVSGSFVVWSLHLGDDGMGQLIYDDNGIKSISVSPSIGWGPTTSLGISTVTSIATDSAGHINILSKPPSASPRLFTLESVHFTPGQGWSAIQSIESTAAEYETSAIELVAIAQGRAFVIYHERFMTSFRLREYIPESGWQPAEVRQIESCDYDDYPSNINTIFQEGTVPTTQLLPADPDVFFNVKTNDQGVISVITTVFGSNNTNMLFTSRYEPQAGWIQDKVLHCPWAFWSTYNISAVSQAMNAAGTTFVFWTYNDNGELQGDLKLLSSKFEMIKGEPPLANAGLNQTVTEGDEVSLDAGLSSDVDNEIVAYHWTQVSGTPVNIADHDTAIATFIAPLISADEVLSFELMVTDDSGNQAIDSVDITVTDFSTTELGVVLSSSNAGPLVVGSSLTLSAQAAGGAGSAYEYQFRSKLVVGGSNPWVILKDFNAVDHVDWSTATLGGKYRLQVRVREVDNETLVATDSITIWINSIDPVSEVNLSSDAIGPQLEGLLTNLSAQADETGGAVEYRFELKNTDIQPGWIVLSDYGSSDNLIWNSSGYLGENKIRVYARREGTHDLAARDTITVWTNLIDAVTSVLLSPSLFSPQLSGTAVTFNASITGGSGVEYRYSAKDTDGLAEWVVHQNWSTTRTITWDTTGSFGKQRVRVEARNSGSFDRALKDEMPYWLNDDNPLTTVGLQMDQSSLIEVGPTINLTAVPEGATSLYEYQFRVKGAAPTASWAVLRDFSSDPNFQVSSASYIGKHKFQVRARNQGTLDKEVSDSKSIWVNSQSAITDIALSGSTSSVNWGESIIFTMSFSGGDGSFYFSKELKNPGEEFSGNEYFRPSTTNSFEFDVGGMMPGTYRMRVQAINAETDKPVKSNSVKFKVNENPDPAWQIGGENYDRIQECTIYECSCAIIGGCYNGGSDTGVFGDGY